MIVIIGLVVLLMAMIAGFAGVLTNSGAAHPLTENFSLLGYHVTGSTGAVFLAGIAVGAVAMLGLAVLLAGAQRTAGRGRDARHQLKDSQRETALLNQERDQRLEHQPADTTTGSPVKRQRTTSGHSRFPLLQRWTRGLRPAGTAHAYRPR
ncbi:MULTISPECIES: hypothetical protein [Mycobacteriaceae]|uniref:Lipopolysaccharide assembly protein A domain-containing protein n=1 Tax=Mycolicibacterium mucogenicum DSM 44124 TaxID=1226753 RepID=A0A8H2JCC2_MYCMU|nr:MULTISPECIES: hypothetical protein [Mycobacteriaceae]QPG71846.1 hypothetical protein C1S78_013430 [Mycolicibacterium mucogenicum DSM 44124]SEB20357.1 hypothetical protein SAMN04488580_110126 [Mycobacterium sp. 283mftsu]